MSSDASQPADQARESLLYKEFLAEREEILRHKWIQSEQQAKDVGFEWALLDWVMNHRTAWRQKRREELAAQQAAD